MTEIETFRFSFAWWTQLEALDDIERGLSNLQESIIEVSRAIAEAEAGNGGVIFTGPDPSQMLTTLINSLENLQTTVTVTAYHASNVLQQLHKAAERSAGNA